MDGLTCMKRFEIHEDYYYAGIKVVSCSLFYPHVLYPNAVQAFLQGSKAFPYEMIVTITLTLQTNEILSFYQQEYLYTGGANGQTTRIGQTINTFTGQIKHLCDFLMDKKNCEICVKNNIIKQIKTSDDPSLYFDNYPSLIEETFHPQNFYLTSEGVVVFFALYDIAPHSTGISTPVLKYARHFRKILLMS